MTLVLALHGFLGQGSDFGFVETQLFRQFSKAEVNFWAPDLFSINGLWGPDKPMQEWAQHLNSFVEKEFGESKKVVVGYSMGGRLAMELLRDRPNLWSGSLMISSNILPIREEERSARQFWDSRWAERFRREIWHDVLSEWNRLPIFLPGPVEAVTRDEEDFDREGLAHALLQWSPIHQRDIDKATLDGWQNAHFVVGLKDSKYIAIQERVAELNSSLHLHQISGGHRLLQENREWLAQKMCELIRSTSQEV
ncbi:MAG: alpha/beta fold hydrolase [Bdellovibrionales bacterium]|nr:alpha/beta fold hydrolase [Bdellovibrionales bacterium]